MPVIGLVRLRRALRAAMPCSTQSTLGKPEESKAITEGIGRHGHGRAGNSVNPVHGEAVISFEKKSAIGAA